MPAQVEAEVLDVAPVGAYHEIALGAPAVALGAEPGQFVALAVGGPDSAMLLRRAFSIHRAGSDGTVRIVFAVHGRGTAWLADRRRGDRVDVVGPLGRPFALPDGPVHAVLVGGGYGSAPLFGLAERLTAAGGTVSCVLGAGSADRLFGVGEAARVASAVEVTTDDGSAGRRGVVTDALPEVLRRAVQPCTVYACGPMAMLRAVTAVAQRYGVEAQTAVEESMACGIGVCMTCVLPVVGDDGVTRMVRSCVEGPVFRGDRVRWEAVGTVPDDTEGAPAGGGHR